MITSSYHDEKESLFSPGAFWGEQKNICDTAIVTFSHEIYNSVLQRYPHREAGHIASANGIRPVWILDAGGREIIFYKSYIGSCMAGNAIIEMWWQTGVKKLILFGSAGSLDSELTTGKLVIPTQAYRDEGLSYHYAPASDYIDIINSKKLEEIFRSLGLPYVCGRIWTTDAPYRETRTAVETRKEEGCIAVEMEIAGVQAVCGYYGIEFYPFVVTGDILDGDEYAPEGLHSANHSTDKFDIALKIAGSI